jgi:hypothetical protein
MDANEHELKRAAFSLSPRGTSGEKVRERGIPQKTCLLSPALSSIGMEERELPSVAAVPRCEDVIP